MTKRIGFIGLGTMGKPMASNLLKAGYPVITCAHVNQAPVNDLKAQGAQVMATPKDVAASADVVVLCLPNTPQVEEALFGPDGVMAGAHPGLTVVDTSTIDPIASQGFAARVCEHGGIFLDAPMSGGESGAIAGTLTFMVGGDAAALESLREVLSAMGKKIYHVGKAGMGEVTKLCNNMMLGINLIGVCEAFTFGAKAGVDPATLAEVIQASSGGSAVIERYFPKTILKNQYKPGFMLKLMCKDMGLALDAANAMQVPTFVGSVAGQVLDLMENRKMGDSDFTVVVTLYQDSAGVIIGQAEK